MADNKKEQTGEFLPHAEKGEPTQQALFPVGISEIIALERERIRSQDKRTDVARAAIDAQKDSDKRQFDYHMARLANAENNSKRKFQFAAKYLWTILGVIVVILVFLFWCIFFGSASQAALGIHALKILATLSTGGAIAVLGRQAWKYFLSDPDAE